MDNAQIIDLEIFIRITIKVDICCHQAWPKITKKKMKNAKYKTNLINISFFLV